MKQFIHYLFKFQDSQVFGIFLNKSLMRVGQLKEDIEINSRYNIIQNFSGRKRAEANM